MNAKEIRDIPQDLLVRLGEEQDMTTTDRIMESLTVLESKSDSRFLAIHGEDEPQVRAAIEKVLAEQGALTDERIEHFERCRLFAQ